MCRPEEEEREPLLQGAVRDANTSRGDLEVSGQYGTVQPINEAAHHSHSHDTSSSTNSSLRALLLSVALSLHSIFEGLAIGKYFTKNL